MKLSSALVLPAICCAARLAVASTAQIFTYDPHTQFRQEQRSSTLDPVAARLVLAQRAGVEDYHQSDLGRADVLNAINEYGVRTPLFAGAQNRNKRATILVESDEVSADDLPLLKSYTSIQVSSAASDESAVRGLFVDLVKQSDPDSFSQIQDTDLYSSLLQGNKYSAKGDMFHVTKSVAAFEALFTRLAKSNEWSITAFVMPAVPAGTVKVMSFMVHEQHQGSEWGSYEMPGTQSPLKRRAQVKEEPLTETQQAHSGSSFSAPISAFAANSTRPLPGILPACFSSQSACESSTRNCTGHGSCIRKYHDGTASKDGSGIDCFICACTATYDEKKTTNWAGPACQKKDVSVEFWLIVLFTVGLIGLIGFAIGTIWEMGQQDLPSVIGAGVSGPSARK